VGRGEGGMCMMETRCWACEMRVMAKCGVMSVKVPETKVGGE
jgi:hypothetical protein